MPLTVARAISLPTIHVILSRDADTLAVKFSAKFDNNDFSRRHAVKPLLFNAMLTGASLMSGRRA